MFLKTLGITLAAVSLSLIATPVKADWEFTRWGMTLEQLKQKSPQKVIPDNDGCEDEDIEDGYGFSSTWSGYGIGFSVCYVFVEDKLVKIRLFSQQDGNLLPQLIKKYGRANITKQTQVIEKKPSGREEKAVMVEWQKGNDSITFGKITQHDGSYQGIVYLPLLK
jgi:hypothetical protein